MAGPDLRTPARPAASGLVGALDLAASKTVCLIGRRGETGGVEIAGAGAQRVRLGPEGPDQDFDTTVRALRIAVDDAERMAGETLSSYAVSYGGPGVRCVVSRGVVALREGTVDETAPRLALQNAHIAAQAAGRATLHVVPLGYQIDRDPPVSDPRGRPGKRLAAEALIVSAPSAAINGLKACLVEAGLRAARIQAAPYAGALGVLTVEERFAGAIVIDLGAAQTGVAAFVDGVLVHAATLPGGQAAATRAIAERLSTSYAAAERVKRAFGGLDLQPGVADQIEAPCFDESGRLSCAPVRRSSVREPVAAAIAEALGKAAASLETLPPEAKGWRVALIGGGAQTPGLRDHAQRMLQRPVRIAAPLELGGPAEASPAYAAVVGALRAGLDPPVEARLAQGDQAPRTRPKRAAAKAVGEAFGWFWRNV